MADYYFTLPGNLTACFKTACSVGEKERLQLGAYVPGLKLREEAISNPDITLEHVFSDAPQLLDDGNYITLCTNPTAQLPDDIYHLLYGIERRELLKQNLYPVHAACVGKDDNYILIVGHSGAGKTTLSHNLVSDDGFKLFSGNKTIMRFDENGSIKAVAGTKTMTALDEDQKRYAYEMDSDQVAPENEVTIGSIMLSRVNDGVEEAQTLSGLNALHSLYPYFMDAVNADIIVNGRDIFDGAASIEAKQNLALALSNSLPQMRISKISGSMEFLKQKVLQP